MDTFKENLDISWNGMVASQKTLDLIFLSKHLNMDYLIDSIVVLESKLKNSKILTFKVALKCTYMNLPIGVVGLTTGVLLFVRDAVLVTLLWSVGEEVTVVRVGVAPVGVAPVNDNVEPVSAAELRLKKDQNGSTWIKMDRYES